MTSDSWRNAVIGRLATVFDLWTWWEGLVSEPHHAGHDEADIWVHMTPAVQADLKAEDATAWSQVVGVLLLIISIGLVLAVGTALFSGVLSVHL
jgi:hypothetical protein